MNVIGIVQTDLNEFNILFEPDDKAQHDQGDGSDGGDGGGFSLFGFGQDDSNSNQGNQQGGQQGTQEMTVRIKGIPEGQKATFLQMYQIIQDAKETKELKKQLTIVSTGDDQQGQGGNRNGHNNGGHQQFSGGGQ